MSGVRVSSSKQRSQVQALHTIFNNDFYRERRAEEEQREAFEVFVTYAPIDLLVRTARTLHEHIHMATKGVYRFTPCYAVREKGPWVIVDPTGKDGFPLSWHPVGIPGLSHLLAQSSQLETELWRRIVVRKKSLEQGIGVFGNVYTLDEVRETFTTHHRDTCHVSLW